jgi:hypothetical protein
MLWAPFSVFFDFSVLHLFFFFFFFFSNFVLVIVGVVVVGFVEDVYLGIYYERKTLRPLLLTQVLSLSLSLSPCLFLPLSYYYPSLLGNLEKKKD